MDYPFSEFIRIGAAYLRVKKLLIKTGLEGGESVTFTYTQHPISD